MVNHDCSLGRTMTPGEIFAVYLDHMAVPAALFICRHCAESWGHANASFGYRLAGLGDAKFVGDFFNKISDVQIIHSAYDGAAVGALYKIEPEVGV